MIRFAVTFAVLSNAAQAQSVKLEGYEITALLSGNTTAGEWGGVPYRQYFDPVGATIYAQDGARFTRGSWRVEGEEYQSIWPRDADWEGWFVMEFSGTFFWVSKVTAPTPFSVLDGRKLLPE